MALEKIAFLPDAVSVWARTAPGKPAVEAPGRSMSYAQLAERSDAAAGAFCAAGVGPGRRAAIFGDKSPELTAAALGAMKAGGAYLCLDPAYPEARLLQIYEDLDACVLAADEPFASRLPAGAVRLPLTGPLPPGRGAAAAGPDDAAYAIFTSGSTGRPKGILLPHRGLANLVQETIPLMRLTPEDRLLQFAAQSFDVSVWETWSALAAGATLVLPGSAGLPAAASVEQALSELGITAAFLAPSLMAVLRPERLPRLRCVVSVGERLPKETAERWARGRLMINGYGPAEATVTVSAFVVEEGADIPPAGPPIGSALPGNELHVLGPDGKEAAFGEAGELCVGGAQVGLGYIGRPELTEERFSADPFSKRPGARLYRTGDLARRRSDGSLEFIGRADGQLKLRGLRIEPGDVEAALRAHPAVLDAVVFLEEAGGRRRLAACFVLRPGSAAGPRELEAWAAGRLPKGMLPESWRRLEEMPRTPNGKIDRRSPVFRGRGDA